MITLRESKNLYNAFYLYQKAIEKAKFDVRQLPPHVLSALHNALWLDTNDQNTLISDIERFLSDWLVDTGCKAQRDRLAAKDRSAIFRAAGISGVIKAVNQDYFENGYWRKLVDMQTSKKRLS